MSEAEVERLANSFAAAYADEDSARISRLLTSDAQRVSPTDRQRGRARGRRRLPEPVRRQAHDGVRARRTRGRGRRRRARDRALPRATPRATPGTMTWNVIREKGRPRIAMIVPRVGSPDLDSRPGCGLRASRVVSGSTSVPAGGSVAQTVDRPAEHAVEPAAALVLARLQVELAQRRRRRRRSSLPTSGGTFTRMSRSHAHGVGRRAPPGRGGGDVDHVAARDRADLGAELAAARPRRPCRATRTAASAGVTVPRTATVSARTEPPSSGSVELEPHARLGRRALGVSPQAASTRPAASRQDQAAHPIDANRAVAPSDVA